VNDQSPKIASELSEHKAVIQAHLVSQSRFAGARKKNLTLLIAFAIWVALPTISAAIYYFFLASPMYVSTAQVTVRDLQGRGNGLLDSFIGKSFGVAGNQDAQVVREFLRSRQVVEELDGMVHLRKIYGDPTKDIISRLEKDSTTESLYNYFLDVSDVEFDPDSSVITIKVRAYTPEQAHLINESAIMLADNLVGVMADRARNDAVAFGKKELETAEARLREANRRVIKFRNEEQDLNPGESAKAVLGILASLQQEIVKTRAQLAEASSYFQPNTVAISTLKTRLAALQEQLRSEQARLVGATGTYPKSLSDYEALNLDLTLAERGYAAALASLDSARKEASQKTMYLVPFVEPNIPDESTYPRKLTSILAIFVGALVSFGITALVVASIREHLSL